MTTTVTVSAHCDPTTTRVGVCVLDDKDRENIYIEDGESQDFHTYDNRQIIVREIPKTLDVSPQAGGDGKVKD
jgi:hypothetical protein